MGEWWRPLAALARSVDGVPGAGSALRHGYELAAKAAATMVGSLDSVEGVYLSGSLTQPRFLRPGSSDIDLVIGADLPTLEAELRFRSRLLCLHRAIHGALPLFTNLDYFDVADLDYFRLLGNAWMLDLDRHWRCLAGIDRLRQQRVLRPTFERRLERLLYAIKRWMKASTRLIDTLDSKPSRASKFVAPSEAPAVRLLADTLAAWLDRDRYLRLERLLSETSPSLAQPSLAELKSGSEPTLERLLAASLEVLDGHATEVCAGWHESFDATGESAALDAPNCLAELSERLLARGFGSVLVLSRGWEDSGYIVCAVGDEFVPALDLVRGMRAAVAGAPVFSGPLGRWLPRPVVLTPSLWRAGALFGPAPFPAARLALGAVKSFGRPFDPPPRPRRADLDVILRGRTVQRFARHLVRVRRPPDEWLAEYALERHVRAGLSLASDHDRFDFRSVLGSQTDRESTDELRAWISERRASLEPLFRERVDQRAARADGTIDRARPSGRRQ